MSAFADNNWQPLVDHYQGGTPSDEELWQHPFFSQARRAEIQRHHANQHASVLKRALLDLRQSPTLPKCLTRDASQAYPSDTPRIVFKKDNGEEEAAVIDGVWRGRRWTI